LREAEGIAWMTSWWW